MLTSPQTLTSTTSSKTIIGLLPNTTYFWRVKAGDGTNFGNYSNIWSFTTNSLENFNLLLPTHNAINQSFTSVLCDWSNSVGASSYQIEIDSNINFTDNPQLLNAGNSTFYTLTNLSPATAYFWHVRASNNGSTFGQWSNTWKFTTSLNTASLAEENIQVSNLFPNPTNELLHAEFDESVIGSTYKIIDLTGKTIDIGKIDTKKQVFSIDKLPKGIYYFGIIGINSKTKIIKE
jgi:hypothetical protein